MLKYYTSYYAQRHVLQQFWKNIFQEIEIRVPCQVVAKEVRPNQVVTHNSCPNIKFERVLGSCLPACVRVTFYLTVDVVEVDYAILSKVGLISP